MRILLMGAKPSFPQASADTVQRKLEQTGWNTGNQIIAYGLLHSLDYSEVSWDYAPGPKALSSMYDVIVVAAANFLFPGFDFSAMAALIEATTLPCMMVGVGAQSNTFSPDIQLPEGTRRLMHVVAERSALIGVRGPFTAEVLANLGIKNVQITGCPSYYMGGAGGMVAEKPRWQPNFRLAVNSSRDVIRHAFDRDDMLQVSRQIGAMAIAAGADFVAQTEQDEIAVAERTGDALDAVARIQAFYRGVADDAAIADWAHRHTRVFWDVDAWLTAMPSYHFVFGTRFHGNIAALKRGVPACVICHDTRTLEMSQFLGLPHVSLKEAVGMDAEALYDRVDMERVSARYAELRPAFREFLNANGVRHLL